MLFTPTLKSIDVQSHATLRSSSVIPTLCGSNCPPQQPPIMIGFGGLRLDSATVASTACSVCFRNSTFVASNVFPGQSQSDTERLVVRMKAMGLNTIRVSFAPYCTNPSGDGHSDSPYSLTDAQNTIKVANYYGFWIVLRYDGDDDLATQTTCWLNYWQTVIQQVGPLYTQIVWEPINEPPQSVSILSANYQLWINMARSLGDTHFVAIESQCSRSCPYSNANMYQAYPTVTDPIGKVLISYHKYYGFNPTDVWTVPAAIAQAQADVATTLKGMQVTGWAALDTEGGTSMGVATCNSSSNFVGCPPGTILPGYTSYSNVTLAYIQTITHLFDTNNPRVGWIWWPIGTWTSSIGLTACTGSYGALQPASCPGQPGCTGQAACYIGGVGWGNVLQFTPVSVTSQPPPSPPPFQPPSTQPPSNQHGSGGICLLCSFKPLLSMLFILAIGIASGLLAVAGLFLAKNRFRDHRKSVLARASLWSGQAAT